MATTVQSSPTPRRVVRCRARPALDIAIETALCEIPPELQPALLAYAEAKRVEYAARSELSTGLTKFNMRWRDVDPIAHELAF